MIQKFKNANYNIVNFTEVADIYIVNTCTVTSISDRKSREILRRAKKINPKSIVVACGCYVQIAKEELEKIKEIDFVLGTNEKAFIVDYVEKYLNSKNYKIELQDVLYNSNYSDFGSVTYTEKTRAVIKIQDGCDRFCTYCIIPYARGKVRSRNPESILKEVHEIANKGLREIVLTGIHIASYGKDFSEKYGLIDLLEELNNIKGIERIRLRFN